MNALTPRTTPPANQQHQAEAHQPQQQQGTTELEHAGAEMHQAQGEVAQGRAEKQHGVEIARQLRQAKHQGTA